MKSQTDILGLTASIVVLTLYLFTAQRVFAHGAAIEVGGGGGPVKLTKEQQAAIGLKTAKADLNSIDDMLVLNGKVQLDPDRHAHVTSRIEGRIQRLFVKVGDKVEKGQVLAEIQSRQIGDPPPTVKIEAIVGGVINDRPVTIGESVDPSKELFHIIDLSQVMVQAEVYEEDVGKVQLGQEARVRVLGYPEQSFVGKITFIGSELDSEKRTLPVWVTVKNPEDKLKPEMFAKVAVVLAHNEGVLAVPLEAILQEGDEKFVFVQTGNTFTRIDVQTGSEDDRFVEIKDGLVPDDLVVTQGKREVYTKSLMGGGVKPPTDTD